MHSLTFLYRTPISICSVICVSICLITSLFPHCICSHDRFTCSSIASICHCHFEILPFCHFMSFYTLIVVQCLIEHIDYFSCPPKQTTKGLSKGSLIGLTSSRTSMQHSLTPTSGPPSTSSLQCWCSLHFCPFIIDCPAIRAVESKDISKKVTKSACVPLCHIEFLIFFNSSSVAFVRIACSAHPRTPQMQ